MSGSYNTRRQGGVGRGASQVMYHQQQTPGSRSAGPVRTSASPQNTTTPGYNSGYTSQSPGGGFQSAAYSSQQYQAQQQVVPPPPPPPMSVQQPPAPKPLHGILKSEQSQQQQQPPPPVKPPQSPATGAGAGGAAGNNMDAESNEGGGDGEEKQRPAWMKKKQFGYKVNKPLKRRRQNMRLRKLLQPKNAIMVLNELVSGVKFIVQEHVNALSQMMYHVTTEIEGKVYTGQAMSKIAAKQIAAENALKSVILDKISKAPLKLEKGPATGTSDNEEGGDKSMDVEDDVPWKSLTSFAIYKLFQEWQSEGIDLPNVGMPSKHSVGTPGQQHSEGNSTLPMKKIPDNPTERHPVMLLHHMKPGCEFIELSRTGNPPDMMFTMQVTLEGKDYTGQGKSKKEAKKETAKAALAGAFDIHYD